MFPSAGDELELKPGGLVIAVVAFVLTRTFLVDVFYRGSDASVLRTGISLLPLLLGLGIVVFGVSLSVSTHGREYVRTVAVWFLGSSIAMLLLVGIGAIAAGVRFGGIPMNNLVTSAVVGGGVGGILLGVQSARGRQQQRQLRQRADQATLLNRLLRHEILNSLTAIRGHAELLGEGEGIESSWDAVQTNSDRIERTIEDVRFLLRADDRPDSLSSTVDVQPILQRCRERLSDRENTLVLPDDVPAVTVRGDDHLETVLDNLATKALERTDGARATVALSVKETAVAVTISASGTWITDPERQALLEGPPEYDDPRVGYDLSITRLLVTRYDGTLSVAENGDTTDVTVELPRSTGKFPAVDSHGVDGETLRDAAVIGIAAGLTMGVVFQAFSGRIGIIGGLYGVSTETVGWTVHLFHSVVFATMAVAARRRPLIRQYSSSFGGTVSLGIVYGFLLWLLAASLVMPLWLTLVGIPTQVPNFTTVSLAAHLVWGVVLGAFMHIFLGETPGRKRRLPFV